MAKSGRELLGEGKFLRLVREGPWEFAERINASGAVAIIAVTKDDRLVLTEQYRPAVDCQVIDLPAGLTGDVPGEENENQAVSALRELVEETGYTAKSLKQVGRCPSSPGLATEIVSLFLARNVTKVSNGGGVEHEQIDVHTPKLATIKSWLSRQIAAGKLIDVKVYAALYFSARQSGT